MHKRIRELRESLKLSQTAFAEKVGMTRSMISNMELGLVDAPDYRISVIVKEFNVNENWLRTGEGGPDNMFVKPSSDSQAIAARVAKEYGSDPLLKAIMTTYLQLDDAKRALLLEIVEGFSVALKDAMTTGKPAPDVSEYIRSRPDVVDAARATHPQPADQSQTS